MVISNHIISGKTKFIAHIGFPTHSFTAPKILNPCFKLLNKDLIVVPMGCKKKDLNNLIKGLKKLDNFFGALITMPHKEKIVTFLQKKKKIVKLTNTCNILKIDNKKKLIGDMTDIIGFENSIKALDLDIKNKNILLIGAGGIGTTLSHYFLTEGVKKVRIHDVNNEKSVQLCEAIRNKSPKFNFKIWNYNKNNFDYLINASPAGTNNEYPVHQNIIKNSKVVVDFVLSNKKTKLLELAKKNNSKVISGYEILINQIPSMLKFFGFKSLSKLELDKIKNQYI